MFLSIPAKAKRDAINYIKKVRISKLIMPTKAKNFAQVERGE